MRMFLFLTVLVVFGGGAHFSGSVHAIDPTECANVVCPKSGAIKCPPGSIEIYSTPAPYEGDELSTDSSMEDTLTTKNANSLTTAAAAADAAAKEDKGKRSVPETDDDLGPHVVSTGQENQPIYTVNGSESLVELCCAQSKCVCDTSACVAPKCEPGFVPTVINRDVGRPGNCCPVFRCGQLPNCELSGNGHTWRENCRSCICFDREPKCTVTSCLATKNETIDELEVEDHGGHPDFHPRMMEKSCFSVETQQAYLNGSHWKENDCTDCFCEDGTERCHTSSCVALACDETTKRLPGECCEKCEGFCPQHEYCNKKCFGGHVHVFDQERGCLLCECGPIPTTQGATVNIHNNNNNTAEETATPPPQPRPQMPGISVVEQEETGSRNLYIILGAVFSFLFFGIGWGAGMIYTSRRQKRSYSTVPGNDLSKEKGLPIRN